jgi:hypothetical protein
MTTDEIKKKFKTNMEKKATKPSKIDGKGRRIIFIAVSPKLHEALKELAKQECRSICNLGNFILQKHFEKNYNNML